MASILQRTTRWILRKVSQRVKKNNLFEQQGERVKQPPVSLRGSSPVHKFPKSKEVLLSHAEDLHHQLQHHQGWCIINHWASWCDGCVEEFPALRSLYDKAQQEKIEVIGISWELFEGGGAESAVQMVSHCMEEYALPYGSWVLLDAPHVAFDILSVEWQKIPQTWLLKDGQRVYVHEGLLSESDVGVLLDRIREG